MQRRSQNLAQDFDDARDHYDLYVSEREAKNAKIRAAKRLSET